MLDLGLDELTDDQAVELMAALVANVCQRSLAAHSVAQEKVWDLAEKTEAAKEALRETVREAREKVIQEFKREALKMVEDDYNRGELALFSKEEEADIIVEATLEAQLALIDRARHTTSPRFFFQVEEDCFFVGLNKRVIRGERLFNPGSIDRAFRVIKELIERG